MARDLMTKRSRVVVATGGHPFEQQPFLDVFAAIDGVDIEHVAQPDVLDRVRPGALGADAVVFYDMPGLRFTGDAEAPVHFVAAPADYVEGLRQLLHDGIGMVFMHHAIASWPIDAAMAELLGGRFHYQPAELDGVAYPDSGYLFDVTHTVEVLDAEHPICAGLPPRFEFTDELYCFPVDEAAVSPLMCTTHPMEPERFYSADLAIRGSRNDRTGWTHPRGSSLVAWTRDVGAGRLAYLQFGDGPVTYADETFRRIVSNAVRWASVPSAIRPGDRGV